MTKEVVNGKQLTDKELEEHQRQQMEQEQRIRQRAEALVRRIGETCDELDRLAEENPELVGRVKGGSEEYKDAYLRLKARLSLADAAPRCRWVRTDGTSCGSPQLKKHIYCFAHRQMMEARALALSLPALEDANAIQVGLMRIQKALIDDTISTKKAGLLLYSMQLALQNVGQVTFGQVKAEELVRETVDEDAALSSQHSAVSQNQTPTTETRRHGEEKSLPRMDAEERGSEENQGLPLMSTDDTDTEKGLPRINADDRGVEYRRMSVEWRPPAEVFRMDTREGMEAYEASFRMKTGTAGDLVTGRSGDRTGDALQKLDIAQTCANVG
ncbi:MAG TPA: hypothetical protein VJW55_15060 [Candidatus Angelobacter sp.]|nr:hypothetical protein [Candidatus Angelobacter sp.]